MVPATTTIDFTSHVLVAAIYGNNAQAYDQPTNDIFLPDHANGKSSAKRSHCSLILGIERHFIDQPNHGRSGIIT